MTDTELLLRSSFIFLSLSDVKSNLFTDYIKTNETNLIKSENTDASY